MWKITEKSCDPSLFDGIFSNQDEREDLFFYNRPLLFSAKNDHGAMVLVHFVEDEQFSDNELISRYIVVPANKYTIEKLKNNELSMHDALVYPYVYIVDLLVRGVNESFGVNEGFDVAWTIPAYALPDNAVPEPDVMLYPEKEDGVGLNERDYVRR